ncbi:MAG TPA: TIGR03905 family TSCPD domain-containing protein [Clostridia bacterium]
MELYNTKGTCARQIIFDVKDNKLIDLKFAGGCSGNLRGITQLVIGQDIDYVIDKLQGIVCRNGTSCPDQLSKALMEYKQKND